MEKKIVFAVLAFACLVGVLSYGYLPNNVASGLSNDNVSPLDLKTVANTENKTVILQDEDNYLAANAATSPVSPLVVAALGLALVASVPIALKILNYNSKKLLKRTRNEI